MNILKKLRSGLDTLVNDMDSIPGKSFNFLIVILIFASALLYIFETLPWFYEAYHHEAKSFESVAAVIFTVEYLMRWLTAEKKWKYPFSFMAIIDVLSILPFYISLFSGAEISVVYLRLLRLFRVFRVFKLARYSQAIDKLILVFKENSSALGVFLFLICIILLFSSSIMYTIEGCNTTKDGKIISENVFGNKNCEGQDIPFSTMADSLWWSIVTMTTVGYGDKYPATSLGRFVAGILMILGIGIIALPTGILGASLTRYLMQDMVRMKCDRCGYEQHQHEARFCCRCGNRIGDDPESPE